MLLLANGIMNRANGRLVSSGERRSYIVYVPPSYQPGTPVPLVITIHGYAGWAAHQATLSGWNELADEYGFIVVYPSGTDYPKHWRTNGKPGSENDPQIEVQFMNDLLDQLQAQYSIDPARIFANGISNGGGMSHLISCALADRVAAIGSVSGAYLYPAENCNPARPVPLIAFHGTADAIVPYLGGPSRAFDIPFPAIPEWMQNYARGNACTDPPQTFDAQGEVSGVHYTGCQDNADVVFYTIQGGGHSWPGGEVLPKVIVGHTTSDINATRTMWAFFSKHPLQK